MLSEILVKAPCINRSGIQDPKVQWEPRFDCTFPYAVCAAHLIKLIGGQHVYVVINSSSRSLVTWFGLILFILLCTLVSTSGPRMVVMVLRGLLYARSGEAILRNVADAVTSLWNLSPVDFPDAFSSSRKWRRDWPPCPCTAMILFFSAQGGHRGREKIIHVNIGASTTFGEDL